MYKIMITSLVLTSLLFGKVRIVASTTDLAAIARVIGGSEVKVESIARGDQDPHYVEVLPSYMLKVKRADVYLKVGAELDLWADQIIDGSRNGDLIIVDCSSNISLREVPATKVSANQGDIHRFGNPHYWLDPENGVLIGETILNTLTSVDPKHAQDFDRNFRDFKARMEQDLKKWQLEFAKLNGAQVLFYHNTWPYFNHQFGVIAADFIEPKPGIMPTPSHLDKLVRLIQHNHTSIIAVSPYFSSTAPDYLKEKTGAKVVTLAPSVGGMKGADTYEKLIEYNLKTLMEAL